MVTSPLKVSHHSRLAALRPLPHHFLFPPMSFRMNTCKSVSKQMTLTPFRMNTYEKHRGEGVLLLTRFPVGESALAPFSLRGSRVTDHGSQITGHRPQVCTALCALSAKSVSELLCSQHVPHSFLKQPGVGVFATNFFLRLCIITSLLPYFVTSCWLFFLAASNSSPGCQPVTSGSAAARWPSANPNCAIFASPVKSHSVRYSSLGWW